MKNSMEKVTKSKEIKIPQKMSSNKVNCASNFKSTFAQSLSFSNSCDESVVPRKKMEKGKFPLFKQGVYGDNYNKSDEDKQKQLWNTNKQNTFEHHDMKLNDDAEVLRMRQECQSLIEENRRLSGLTQTIDSVQNVVLQTKIETLQWQLDQVETSRQMHRALMEEVVRYLEKCHHNLSLLQMQQLKDKTTIERSKSLLYMAKCKFSNDLLLIDNNNGRARSSTNLIDVLPPNPKSQTLSESTVSYSAFKDFTWRRTPKESKIKIEPPLSHSNNDTQENHVLQDYLKTLPTVSGSQEDHNSEVIIEKLSKEAFRLLRTVQNFLNTHEPSLTIPTLDKLHTMNHQVNNDFLYDFSRKKAARNSHLSSMRSSSACSVHSSSASSNKECEIVNSIKPKKITSVANEMPKSIIRPCHQIENESGFSSMTSYHEIGLPLINSNVQRSSISSPLTIPIDIKRASIASVPISSPEIFDCTDVSSDVGSPSTPPEPKTVSDDLMTNCVKNSNHRRWDSVPIISQNKLKIHSNDKNSMRVLWV